MPGMGKSGKRRRAFSRVNFALASSAAVEEEEVDSRPEAWPAVVELEASGLAARLPLGSDAADMLKGREEKRRGRGRRGGIRGSVVAVIFSSRKATVSSASQAN